MLFIDPSSSAPSPSVYLLKDVTLSRLKISSFSRTALDNRKYRNQEMKSIIFIEILHCHRFHFSASYNSFYNSLQIIFMLSKNLSIQYVITLERNLSREISRMTKRSMILLANRI